MDEKTLEGGRLFMSHKSYNTWRLFVKDELSVTDRQLCEEHLYTCDECLQLYLKAMEDIEASIPPLLDHSFTNHVMEQIETKTVSRENDQSLFRRKLLHYLIATAMTVMLMGSGIFTQLVETVKWFDGDHQEQPSLITSIMNSSTSIIEDFKNESKGDKYE